MSMSNAAGKEIFIVDDDNDTRNALSELLEAEGFSVDGAANGREALARLRSGRVHPLETMGTMRREFTGITSEN